MPAVLDFDSLLVPVDFSPISAAMMNQAVQLASGEEPLVIMLHVLDVSLVEFAVTHGLGDRDQVQAAMRKEAESSMAKLKEQIVAPAERAAQVDVQAIITEGLPFLEILRKSEEFQVGAILLGKQVDRGGIERLLFGSTAERIIRGSRRPVIVMPFEGEKPQGATIAEEPPRADDVGG